MEGGLEGGLERGRQYEICYYLGTYEGREGGRDGGGRQSEVWRCLCKKSVGREADRQEGMGGGMDSRGDVDI